MEELWVDSLYHNVADGTYAESVSTLAAGQTYNVEVVGNHAWHPTMGAGAPDAILFPSPDQTTYTIEEAGRDADVIYADTGPGGPSLPRHVSELHFDLGSGFVHIEPEGGPFSVPDPDHRYVFAVTGAGQRLRAAINDSAGATFNNSGMYRLRFTVEAGFRIGRVGIGPGAGVS